MAKPGLSGKQCQQNNAQYLGTRWSFSAKILEICYRIIPLHSAYPQYPTLGFEIVAMDVLLKSYDAASQYPKNLVTHQTYDHTLTSYVARLDDREDDLFYNESNAAVDFWQYDHAGQGFWHKCVSKHVELQDQLRVRVSPQRFDPKCLFIFLHAPHSRERLNVSRKMLLTMLTYYQVMPAFLDFLFPFGRSADVQDFLYSGFRHETRLAVTDRGIRVPELDRSGRRLQLCYSLRSPSLTNASSRWPWSIQQTAIYHSFDVETGQSLWMLVKGDLRVKGDGMKDRVISATKSPNFPNLSTFGTRDESFAAVLGTHQLFADWAGENWRWYVNFLEQRVQEITRKTLDVTIGNLSDPPMAKGTDSQLNKGLPPQGKQKSATWSVGRVFTNQHQPPLLPVVQPSEATSQGPPKPPQRPPGPSDLHEKQDSERFSFDDLQEIEFVEEKTNETLLVLKTLVSVLSELKGYYPFVTTSKDCPKEMKQSCKRAMIHFKSALASVEVDLKLQLSRVETLLRLLADRKTLLYGILQSQSTHASKLLAHKAQQSANKMQEMTEKMHQIAIKTQEETVSMKVITVVTLFFLPGTFISTLMSTDIIKFQQDTGKSTKLRQVYSSGALVLFLKISLPLMAATFIAWSGVYLWIKHRQQRELAGMRTAATI